LSHVAVQFPLYEAFKRGFLKWEKRDGGKNQSEERRKEDQPPSTFG